MSEPSTTPGEITFPARYDDLFNGVHNLELTGSGELRIQPESKLYTFTGYRRRALIRRRHEITFGEQDISNATADGRKVEFSTTKGICGERQKRFVFFASNPEAARTIVAQLPKEVDFGYTAANDFNTKLQQLTAATPPWVSPTMIIIVLNVAMFLVMGFAGAGWFEVTNLTQHIRFGANNGAATTDGGWWRIIAAMFIHYGFIHLTLNMWALYRVGPLAERLFSPALFAIGYLGSGIIGGFTSLIWHGDKTWSAGASGAVFGVYGLLLGYMVRDEGSIPRVVYQPLLKSTLFFAGYNLFYGMAHAGIDNAAHLGGLGGGFLLGLLLAVPLEVNRVALIPRRIMTGVGALILVCVFGIMISPRFSYSVDEEMAWSRVVKPMAAQEQDRSKRVTDELNTFISGKSNGAALRRELQDASRFYSDWSAEVTKVQLTPGRLTARRRDIFLEILKMQIASYRGLADELPVTSNDLRMKFATRQHNEANAIARKIQEMAQLK